jgi:hypothetical protein
MSGNPSVDYTVLTDALNAAPNSAATLDLIVNAPFTEQKVEMALLFLGIISFYLIDEPRQEVYMVGASDTEYYHLAIKHYPFDPKEYRLALSATDNPIVQAILQGEAVHYDDWGNLRRPGASVDTVRLNQATSGIAAMYIYPLTGTRRGALMYNFFQYGDGIGAAQLEFMERYTNLVSGVLSRADTH